MTETQETPIEEGSTSDSLSLTYRGLSAYQLDSRQGDDPQGDIQQRLCLFLDEERQEEGARLRIKSPLLLREGLRSLLELNGLRGIYQPEDAETYEAYSAWRRGLDPQISPINASQAFYDFLAQHDPEAWVGCDPTVTLSSSGLTFELLDPTGRLYGALSFDPSAYELTSDASQESSTQDQSALCAHFEGSVTLREGLSMINHSIPLTLSLGSNPEDVEEGCRGALSKRLPAPKSWQRNYTQLLSSSTLESRRVHLTRMDLYNILQHLRLNSDPPKQKKGIRFELIPGKPPALTLEPWGIRLQSSGEVYRGDRAELIGVWDRRDLLVFDALLPYVDQVEVHILGEAQPTFWMLRCGPMTFTLGSMGFRPNNWSRGLLLDLSLPRASTQDSSTLNEVIVERLNAQGALSADALQTALLESGHVDTQSAAHAALRGAIQAGRVLPDRSTGTLTARRLFNDLDDAQLLYRNEREARAHELVTQGRVHITLGELPTGEVEVKGQVSEPSALEGLSEPMYAPQFQILEGAGMRKLSCDCAWMKDREKQKIGPCPHAQALWLRYSIDEATRLAEIAAHPERVEFATAAYVRRRGEKEQSRYISLKRKTLEERWEDSGEEPRRTAKVFSSIVAARVAYFKRVAELERRDYMDASQS